MICYLKVDNLFSVSAISLIRNNSIVLQNRYAMAAKFVIYLVINTLIFDIPGASYKVFWPFQFILNVKGNLRYWVYRST